MLEGISPVDAACRLIVLVQHPFDHVTPVEYTAGHAALHTKWAEIKLAAEIVEDRTEGKRVLAFQRPRLHDWTAKQSNRGAEGMIIEQAHRIRNGQ